MDSENNGESRAFFSISNKWIVGNDEARGPWSPDACHAGPVTGMLARAVERIVPEKQLTRLTVSLYRPIPMTGFRIYASLFRDGRGTASSTATLKDRAERVCAIASGLHLSTHEFADLPTASLSGPQIDDATPGDFPVRSAVHGLAFFRSGIEVAYPPGESPNPGPTTMWMRTLPLLQDETPSPFQSLCPIADCGNGISRNTEISEASCINADLTLIAYRLPTSRWLASSSRSFWEPTGIGMSHAVLYDEQGALGAALQTLIVKPLVPPDPAPAGDRDPQ